MERRLIVFRNLQLIVPTGKLDKVTKILDESEVTYVVQDEERNESIEGIVTFNTKTDEVEGIVDSLRKLDIDQEGWITIQKTEAIIDDENEEDGEDGEDEEEDEPEIRISRDELKVRAQGLSRSTSTYLILTLVSAVIATAGLILDSPSIVVGSMVIAPLIGPTLASSVATVINDAEMFRDGLKSQFLGLGVAIMSALLFAIIVRGLFFPEIELQLIGQVAERYHPGLLLLAVALGAGVAGSLSLTSGMSEALVGVMIAVALIPPAASVGVGVAYLDMALFISSLVLVLVNLLSINLAALFTLWSKGYRPEKWYEEKKARRTTIQRSLTLLVLVLVLTAFLAFNSYTQKTNSEFESNALKVIDEIDGEQSSVEFQYTSNVLGPEPEAVYIRSPSANIVMANQIHSDILSETGIRVEVKMFREEVYSSSD